MDIKSMNMEQVVTRRSAIKDALENEELTLEAVEAFEEEVNELNSRKAEIESTIEKRKKLEKSIIDATGLTVLEARKEGEKNMNKEVMTVESMEYRSAFLKNIRGIQLNEVEQRAFSTAAASAGAVVPTVTQNKIIELLEQEAPLLGEIDLLRVAGGISIPVENPISDASKHAENATINASEDKVIQVNLFGYEVTKLLAASKSILRMSVDAFETWLVRNLVRSLTRKIKRNILFGTGTGEAKGINTITWGAENSVTVAKEASLTTANVLALIGLLPGVFDPGAKWIMSKKTLLTSFLPLQDKAKNDLVQLVNGVYHIQGYPVLQDDDMPLGEAFLGNLFEGYKGNMPEEINITADFTLNKNAYEFLGAAMFDGKPVLESAFVKLVKAAE